MIFNTMNEFKPKGGCWPTTQQELLLKAALLKGAESIQSWEKWIECTDLQTIDYGSQRLLPILMVNLRSQDIQHPAITQFKELYRRAWYKNQMLFKEMAGIIRSFQDAEIETMILKGAALIVEYYKNPGFRPMDDFDLLVPASKIRHAIELLKKQVWNPLKELENINDTNAAYQRALHFTGQSGNELDLHQHIFFSNPDEDADQDFWSSAVPVMFNGIPTLTLNPTDQLLHTIVHGLSWTDVPSLRWVADAQMILQRPSTIDWDRLIFQSQKLKVALTVKLGLRYLADKFFAPLPPDILDRVQRISVSPDDRLQYRIYCHSQGLLSILLRHWYTYKMYFSGKNDSLRTLLEFPRFLQHFWKLDSLMRALIVAMKKWLQLLGVWWKEVSSSRKKR